MSSTLHIVLDEQDERRVRRLKEEMDVTWAEFMSIAAENRREMLESVRDSTDGDSDYGGPFVELAGSLKGETDEEGRTGSEILRTEREKERQKEREMLERLGIEDSESDE
jgi:NurA-like 5'-3' nuclease